MSLNALVWGKFTAYATSPLDRVILMDLGDQAREHDNPKSYRVTTTLDALAEIAVTDEAAVRTALAGLVDRGALTPVDDGTSGDLTFLLTVDN